MKMVSSKLTRICIGLIVVGLIVPGATLAKTELKDMAGLWLFDEGSAKWSKIVPVTITFRPGSKYSA